MQGLLYFVAYNTTIAGLRFRLDNPAIVMYDCVWQLNSLCSLLGEGGGGAVLTWCLSTHYAMIMKVNWTPSMKVLTGHFHSSHLVSISIN